MTEKIQAFVRKCIVNSNVHKIEPFKAKFYERFTTLVE